MDRYGSPCAVNIELARELSKNFDERKEIERDNLESERKYQDAIARLRGEFNLVNPKGADVLKLRLYEEQGGKCAYSQKPIEQAQLFGGNCVQIDHIIPYSRSFDDSFNNKVLVLTKENQDKGNKTPFEYFGTNEARWSEFEAFVSSQYAHNVKKRKNLLCRSFSEDNANDWKARALNDTKYISRFVYNLLNDYLYLQPTGKKKQVTAVNGRITAYLRKFWGLTKVREDGDKHHALDAAVIACVTDGIIQKITKYNQIKERSGVWDRESRCYKFADGDGVLLKEDEYDDRNGYIAKPYVGFRDELLLRLDKNPQYYVAAKLMLLQSLDYSEGDIENLSPVFVSRMPNRKAHGAIHKETVRSARSLDRGVSASKTPLTSLKLTKDKSAIEGYDEKAKRDDKLLYEALYSRLSEFDGDAKKAFSEPFYKPTKDGKQGNFVKKVWITEAFNAGVKLGGGTRVADNGGMVRVDVFAKGGKYFCVPVYIKDIYAKHLPDRAITPNKKYDEWDKIDDSFDFLFTLYPNDLIYVEARKEFNLKSPLKDDAQAVQAKEGYYYYKTIDISTGAAEIITHDNGLRTKLGFKTLIKLQKHTVDVLGEKHLVTNEKRLNTQWDT
ncbi:MAG: type II CRISPR RNA-guided endonuclease Cas9 [Muribaculaceae bacterium]|nr:type II CRISPR RNA-guided endonuclease Cas9 [Muribaculaceae bacterium]